MPKKMTNKSENNNTHNFFSGFVLGSVVTSVACYLTLTKAGRKTARELLRKAEKIGEEGQDYLEELIDNIDTDEIKEKSQKKIGGIINKLKRKVGFVKKKVDN